MGTGDPVSGRPAHRQAFVSSHKRRCHDVRVVIREAIATISKSKFIAGLSFFSLKASVPECGISVGEGREKMHDVVSTPAALKPADFSSASAYVAAVKALTDPPAHLDDAAMAKEHAALFALVPRAEATHVAVKDGSWFDPSTWSDGQIPGAGAKVLIPEAISVNYDGVSDASLFTVRVDGKLLFAPDHNTSMVVDTLVAAKTGLLQIGTSDHPIQDGVTANITIADKRSDRCQLGSVIAQPWRHLSRQHRNTRARKNFVLKAGR